MKGTDITKAQMKHAEEFVMAEAIHGCDGPRIAIQREDLFRLMAWYAAVRVQSGNPVDQFGSIEDRRTQ
jgi:hypothetical protein